MMVFSSVLMTRVRPAYCTWRVGMATCHWIGPGPTLTSGGSRPSWAAALTAWRTLGTALGVGRGRHSGGQGRTKSPPGPNWHNGRLLIACYLSTALTAHGPSPPAARRAATSPVPLVGGRPATANLTPARAACSFWSLFALNTMLTSDERQAEHEIFLQRPAWREQVPRRPTAQAGNYCGRHLSR
jgi:hypothetical protein